MAEITKDNWHNYIMNFETGQLSDEEVIQFFQYLIDEGHCWRLQGFYGRTADDFIQSGYCTYADKRMRGYWGNLMPSKHDFAPGLPGTDLFVQKRKELNDDDFSEWAYEIGQELEEQE